jgi:Transposase
VPSHPGICVRKSQLRRGRAGRSHPGTTTETVRSDYCSGCHQPAPGYDQSPTPRARKLSWKETAEPFRPSWDKVHDAVSYLVTWGLEHRVLGPVRAIGVDEIQRGKGHKYLTLVYQIDLGCTRLLWIGKERTVKTFNEFLYRDWPGCVGENRVRLLGHVETVFGRHSRKVILDRFHIWPR